MLISSEGIIVRTVKYGETSLILDIFSRDKGIQSYIIGGVRSKKGKSKASMLRVLSIVNFVAYDKGGDKLNRLKEISYAHVYKTLPFDVVKGSVATLLIEICRKAIKASDSYEELYNFIVKGLVHLDNVSIGLAHFHILFLIELAKKLGFEMHDNFEQNKNDLFDLKEGGFVNIIQDRSLIVHKELSIHLHHYLIRKEPYTISKDGRRELLDKIIDYFKYHIEGFGELKSLPVLHSLYS